MRPRRNLRPREQAPLPAAKIEQLPLVFDGVDRIIAPWPTHAAMTETDQRRLLCVLDYIRVAHLDRPCWVWPDREPVPIGAPDITRWIARWSEGRASYVTRAMSANSHDRY